eukprot:266506_1
MPRKRQRTRRNHNIKKDCINNEPNENTNNQPPKKKQKKAKSTPETYVVSHSDSTINIHSIITHKKQNKIEEILLQFKMLKADGTGNKILEVQENDKQIKTATSGGLNKYKKLVLVLVLVHFFKYELESAKILGKGKVLTILCCCCSISLDNPGELIKDFVSGGTLSRVCEFMEEQRESILHQVRTTIQCDKLLNMNNNFDDDYCSLFIETPKCFEACLNVVWSEIIKIFKKNPDETKMLKQFLILCTTMNENEQFKQLKEHFDITLTATDWYMFKYGLINSSYNHFKHLLKQELTNIALEEAAKKVKPAQKDTNDKDYLVSCMVNSTANSLLRKYHGFNFSKENKIYLVSIVNAMLFKYKNLQEFIESENNCRRLCLENRGGMRSVLRKFWALGAAVVDKVTPNLNNLFFHNGCKLQSLLDKILQETDDLNEFKKLFDIKSLTETVEEYLSKMNGDVSFDKNKLEKYMKRVYLELRRGVAVRPIWSYIKKYKQENDTLTLRAKLQIYHLSDSKKVSSLQTNSN